MRRQECGQYPDLCQPDRRVLGMVGVRVDAEEALAATGAPQALDPELPENP